MAEKPPEATPQPASTPINTAPVEKPAAAATAGASTPAAKKVSSSGSGAVAVASGILLSRLAGLVRDRALAHFLGTSDAAGAYRAASRIPNLLQNLFGEGALSASFVPVYTRQLTAESQEAAAQTAGAVASLLFFVVSIAATIGVMGADAFVSILAPGFTGETRTLTVALTKILFPGTAAVVMSAWCLGILNSHRQFFLSYVAPVAWNGAIIGALFICAMRSPSTDGGDGALALARTVEFATWAAWGVTVGSFLQFLVQFPKALRLNALVFFRYKYRQPAVREILRNFIPTMLARGVVQLSAYIDQILSSFLGAQMVAALAYAQTLYMLPISLFGIAISTAELPELARENNKNETDREKQAKSLTKRIKNAERRLAFFIIPSVAAFMTIGDLLIGGLYQTGRFGSDDRWIVWLLLWGMTCGLFATTASRLYASVFWAFGDTRRPAVFALARVGLNAVLGLIVVLPMRSAFEIPIPLCGAFFVGVSAVGSWLEYSMYQRMLRSRSIFVGLSFDELKGIVISALSAGIISQSARILPIGEHPLVQGISAAVVFGGIYLAAAALQGVPETSALYERVMGKLKQTKKK